MTINGWAACMRGGYVEHEHVDGIDLIVRLRTWSQTPIIVPSVRNAERDLASATASARWRGCARRDLYTIFSLPYRTCGRLTRCCKQGFGEATRNRACVT
jgi:hypothetical protein